MCHGAEERPLQTMSPVLGVEQDLASQWQLQEAAWAQVLSCVSALRTVRCRAGCRLRNAAAGISAEGLLEVSTVLCNLAVLSSRFMKQVPKGSKIK